MGEKHYVYSARTTKDGLAVLNKARGDRGWDGFVNEAVCGHYGLDLSVIARPPSKLLAEREDRGKAKEERPTEQPPANETGTEQPAATEQEQPAEGKRPAKKKGRNK